MKKIWGTFVCAGACVAIISGCGGASSGGKTQKLKIASTNAAACTAAPKQGGSLTYERGYETETLNPLSIRNGNGDIFADAMIYQGLVQYAPDGSTRIIGGVAKSWTVSRGATVYTFHLRPGVRFSNGQPVTAQDVKFSLDRFGNTKVNQVMSVVAVGYQTSKILNPSTVQITLSRPTPSFLDNIAIFPAFIVPKKLVEQEGNAFWSHPVGSGPFKFASFVSGSHVSFARNPYYWDKPLPYLNSVTFNFATDSNSRLLALSNGAAQEADEIEPSQVVNIQKNAHLVLQSNQIPGWISLYPNESFKPLASPLVRQALADAINRQAINSEIFHGLATIPNSVFGHFQLDGPASKVPNYAYDPTKAKALLARAGYSKGFAVTLAYPAGFDYFGQLTLLLKQELGQVGVRVKLAQQNPAAVTAAFSARHYQLSFGYPEVTSDVAVPDEYAGFYALPNPTDGFFTGWHDPSIAASVLKFVANPSPAARATEWPQIQEALMQQQPAINILDQPLLSAHAKSLCGTKINDLGVDQLWDTWLASSK